VSRSLVCVRKRRKTTISNITFRVFIFGEFSKSQGRCQTNNYDIFKFTIYIYGRWHLIMAGRVGHPSGGIGGLTTELQKCFVICHASGASLCIPCQIWGGALMPSIGSGVKIDFVLRASRCLTFYRAWRVSASSEGRNLDAISPQRCARKKWPASSVPAHGRPRASLEGSPKYLGEPPRSGRVRGIMPTSQKTSVSRARNDRLR